MNMTTEYFDRGSLTSQIVYRSTTWIWQLDFCKTYPHLSYFVLFHQHNSKVSPAQSINCLFYLIYQVVNVSVRLWLDFISYFLFYYIYIFSRVLSPKTILVLRVAEYSTISMLDYFKDNLSNVGLPEAWTKW